MKFRFSQNLIMHFIIKSLKALRIAQKFTCQGKQQDKQIEHFSDSLCSFRGPVLPWYCIIFLLFPSVLTVLFTTEKRQTHAEIFHITVYKNMVLVSNKFRW